MFDTTTSSHPALTREQLEQALTLLGYTVVFRETGWSECLVVGHEEAWVGEGTSKDEALRVVLRRMFPSKASWACLEKSALVRPANEAPTAELREAEPPQEALVSKTASPESSSPTDPLVVENVPLPTVLVDHRRVNFTPTLKPKVSEPTLSVAEAMEILHEILTEIQDERDDVAMMSTLHQRVHLSSWIFRARSVQEQLPCHRMVEETVHTIALKLTSFCKKYWPGSVRALQVEATPFAAISTLGRAPVKSISKWSQAAEWVEEYIEDLEERVGGQDEYGWIDQASLTPPAPDASKVLEEVVDRLHQIMPGMITATPEVRAQALSVESLKNAESQMVLCAGLLRWIRRSCLDRETWGSAMGALRWAAHFADLTRVRTWVSDITVPRQSWATEVDRDPRVNALNKMKHEVISSAPTAMTSREQLVQWLQNAFTAFTNPQIVKLAPESKQDLLALTNEDFSSADRNIRSRLRKLQTIIRTGEDVSRASIPKIETLSLAKAETITTISVETVEDILRDAVREKTRGKRMLFVSNRKDEPLRTRLETELACEVALRDGGSDRKLEAILASIGSQSYDMVLMATGFSTHACDASLARAAKAASIPYVRVNKGRPLATIRALARTFGFQEAGPHVPSAS